MENSSKKEGIFNNVPKIAKYLISARLVGWFCNFLVWASYT